MAYWREGSPSINVTPLRFCQCVLRKFVVGCRPPPGTLVFLSPQKLTSLKQALTNFNCWCFKKNFFHNIDLEIRSENSAGIVEPLGGFPKNWYYIFNYLSDQ